jgi:hypothetical protein
LFSGSRFTKHCKRGVATYPATSASLFGNSRVSSTSVCLSSRWASRSLFSEVIAVSTFVDAPNSRTNARRPSRSARSTPTRMSRLTKMNSRTSPSSAHAPSTSTNLFPRPRGIKTSSAVGMTHSFSEPQSDFPDPPLGQDFTPSLASRLRLLNSFGVDSPSNLHVLRPYKTSCDCRPERCRNQAAPLSQKSGEEHAASVAGSRRPTF